MKTNYLISINDPKDILIYKKVFNATFLFALENYSVGYPKTFTIEEINKIEEPKYILINRLLNSKEIDCLKNMIDKFNGDGYVIEDIGLINVLKPFGKKIILFMNHFNCNYVSINEWLDYVDSVMVSNELTFKEIEEITKNAKRKVSLHIFGHNQVMYSRRLLLKNYYQHFNLPAKNNNLIRDKQTNIEFYLYENAYGTVCYSKKIFAGRKLLALDNVLFYYLNTSYIDVEDVLKFLRGEDISNSDDGFLNKETIYKLEAKK